LCGAVPDVLKKTPFEQYHQVFEGAWGRIEAAIRKAESYGIGVFVGESLSMNGKGLMERPSLGSWRTKQGRSLWYIKWESRFILL
jgi:hypothetical protein